MKIGVVTDSSAGFSLEDMKNYPDIMIVPLVITEEGDKFFADDNVEISSDTIYQKLIVEQKNLKTSQTNREVLRQYWNNALSNYDQLIFLPIGKAASGQYEGAKVLESEFNEKVYVYETGAASIALKAMAIIAWKLSTQNQTLKQIITAIDMLRKNYQFFITPSRLNYLVRGGRIPASLAQVSDFLKLKAIINCKEKIKKEKIKRTMTHSIKDMLNFIVERTKNATSNTLYVINAWCSNDLINLAVTSAKKIGFNSIKIEPLCNILKTHTGDNTIGFAVIPNSIVKEI